MPYPRRYALLLVEQGAICALCGLGQCWNEQPLRLQYDHKNGDGLNNARENSRLLCPNCHSQTETFCVRNIARCHDRVPTVADKTLLAALSVERSIRKALIKVGLTGKGANYERAYRLLQGRTV